jgi:hypothetical protein
VVFGQPVKLAKLLRTVFAAIAEHSRSFTAFAALSFYCLNHRLLLRQLALQPSTFWFSQRQNGNFFLGCWLIWLGLLDNWGDILFFSE